MKTSEKETSEVDSLRDESDDRRMNVLPSWDEDSYGPSGFSHRERRWEIILAYLHALEGLTDCVAVENDLPFSKGQIKCALLEELEEGQNIDLRNYLEIAYVQLEAFIPYEEYRVIADFKYASGLALEMAFAGDPSSIIRSARIIKGVKGERAVRIQEKISANMRRSKLEVDRLRSGMVPQDAAPDESHLHCPQ
ncbi:MAG: hypothetical protein LLG06_07470 [Desulfobacteraceae bacterium]|nr:hypothetical protein [Desulfobacteraceae bacterium]